MYTKRRRRDSSDNRYNVRQKQWKRETKNRSVFHLYILYNIFIYNIVTVAVCYVTCPVNFLMNSSFRTPPPGTLNSWKKKYLTLHRQYIRKGEVEEMVCLWWWFLYICSHQQTTENVQFVMLIYIQVHII